MTLIPGKPFALNKPVHLQVDGQPSSGLQDSSGRYIDGAHTGTPGGNAIAILSRRGTTVEAIAPGTTGDRNVGIMAVIDALFEQDALAVVSQAD